MVQKVSLLEQLQLKPAALLLRGGLPIPLFVQDSSARQTATQPAQAAEPEESQMQDAEGVDGDGQVGSRPVHFHDQQKSKQHSGCRVTLSLPRRAKTPAYSLC